MCAPTPPPLGLVVDSDVSQDQIDVLAAGPVCRAECMQAQSASKDQARGTEKALNRGGRKLMQALQQVRRGQEGGGGPAAAYA